MAANVARFLADDASMETAIRAAASSAPCLVLSHRTLQALDRRMGGMRCALRWLLQVAEGVGRPIGLNVPAAGGRSNTVFISPSTWTEQRLQGWVAGHHELLEQEFGAIGQVRSAGPGERL